MEQASRVLRDRLNDTSYISYKLNSIIYRIKETIKVIYFCDNFYNIRYKLMKKSLCFCCYFSIQI